MIQMQWNILFGKVSELIFKFSFEMYILNYCQSCFNWSYCFNVLPHDCCLMCLFLQLLFNYFCTFNLKNKGLKRSKEVCLNCKVLKFKDVQKSSIAHNPVEAKQLPNNLLKIPKALSSFWDLPSNINHIYAVFYVPHFKKINFGNCTLFLSQKSFK